MSRTDRELTDKIIKDLNELENIVSEASQDAGRAEQVLTWLDRCGRDKENPIIAKIGTDLIQGSGVYGAREVEEYLCCAIRDMMPEITDKIRAVAQSKIDHAAEILKQNGVK